VLPSLLYFVLPNCCDFCAALRYFLGVGCLRGRRIRNGTPCDRGSSTPECDLDDWRSRAMRLRLTLRVTPPLTTSSNEAYRRAPHTLHQKSRTRVVDRCDDPWHHCKPGVEHEIKACATVYRFIPSPIFHLLFLTATSSLEPETTKEDDT
jgi:hypothetical protein